MTDTQLDLFSGAGLPVAHQAPPSTRPRAVPPGELDDGALLAAIPGSGVADGPSLVAEAGCRRLAAAIPILED